MREREREVGVRREGETAGKSASRQNQPPVEDVVTSQAQVCQSDRMPVVTGRLGFLQEGV